MFPKVRAPDEVPLKVWLGGEREVQDAPLAVVAHPLAGLRPVPALELLVERLLRPQPCWTCSRGSRRATVRGVQLRPRRCSSQCSEPAGFGLRSIISAHDDGLRLGPIVPFWI